MKKLLTHPAFLVGLLIRLLMIGTLSPPSLTGWYQPFLQNSIHHFTADPWSSWMAAGGTLVAFPYGYVMWLIFLPLTALADLAGVSIGTAYSYTLLACDLLMLWVLVRLLPGRTVLLLCLYWLSPIVILATYGLGLNDVLPVMLLTASMYQLREHAFRVAGALCAAAISAKLSMVLALPFILIYLFNNRPLRQRLAQFIAGFMGMGVLAILPILFSGGARTMLLNNPEMGKVYRLALDLGNETTIYLIPLTYMLMLYHAWRVRRLNFELFQSSTGLAFLLIILMTPASPGWFIWCLPFLVAYQARSGRMAILLASVFSVLYILNTLLHTALQFTNGLALRLDQVMPYRDPAQGMPGAMLFTCMVTIGIVLALRIWRQTIQQNDFFRLSRKPFSIGIAGDSGAGKDTYATGIAGLFGNHSVVQLSGDDYHLWDRQRPMWQVMTHLNPMANDLEGFCHDLIALTKRKAIHSRHYDHQTGKMSKPHWIRANDFVIASGLHALYLPLLRDCYNLKVYLDIDEALRRHFKLERDVKLRGHSVDRVMASFVRREPDSERFIRPQAQHADLVLSLQPIHPNQLLNFDKSQTLRLKLVARSRNGLNEISLTRVLVGVCGLHVDMEASADGSETSISIEGESSAEDIALAAHILCPRLREYLDISPQWQDGVLGLMQIITLSHINQALTKRTLS
jgi:uridine kinase